MKKLLVCALVAAFALATSVEAGPRGKQGPEAIKKKVAGMKRSLRYMGRYQARIAKALGSAQGEDKEVLEKAAASLKAVVEQVQAAEKAAGAEDWEAAGKAVREVWKAQQESRSLGRMAEMVIRIVEAKALAEKLADKPEAAAKAKALVGLCQRRLALEKQVMSLDGEINKTQRELKGAGRKRRPKGDKGKRRGKKGGKRGKSKKGGEEVIE